jgi:hypothetical protein
MAKEPKTRKTKASVAKFLNSLKNVRQREDSFAISEMMQLISGRKPEMWGPAIVGYGSVMLKYADGKKLEWPQLAFSPRKNALTLYVLNNPQKQNGLLKKLGRHKTGKICLYIKNLSDVDTAVLKKIIEAAV